MTITSPHNETLTEIRKLATLEDTHWWYRERRTILARQLRALELSGVRPGRALDIGAAGGGNTRVLQARGWSPVALEYSQEGSAGTEEEGPVAAREEGRGFAG